MTSVTLPGAGGTVTFKYDPFGRRIYKSSTSGTSVYAYDGDNLIEETNATGGVVARYEQTQNIDEPLAMLRTSATSYFQADGLGSITSLSNSAGTIANTYTYDSYGDLTASTGTLVNSFRYTSRESDPETGLYYYRARYYDTSTGRFLNEDRIGFLSGIDFYAYVRNTPTKYRDPSGKDPIIGVTVGAIAGTVQGALGAALAGGSGKEILVAALIGGGAGAAIGFIDPTAGIGTLAIIGGAAGGVGDVIGQLITGAGTKCKPFNYGSTVGAVAGGALAGAGGAGVSLDWLRE